MSGPKPSSVSDEAAALIAEFNKPKPCIVERSGKATLIDALLGGGASQQLIVRIFKTKFQFSISGPSLKHHRDHTCSCYRAGAIGGQRGA